MKKNRKYTLITAAVLMICIAFVIILLTVILPNREKNGEYRAAAELYSQGKYEEAIAAFTALDGYKDSAEQIAKCETAINDGKYNAAVELYNAKKYGEAYAALTELNGYRDSAELLAELKPIYFTQMFADAEPGSTVFFGSYEQSYNPGKEDIEWIVLDKQEDRLLVISKYGLDCQRFSTSYTDITWETSPLRTWLNETFLNEAFTAQEQARIPRVTVTADRNPYYDTDPGADTEDQIFLLSVEEAYRYFADDSARKCRGTDYCYDSGADRYPNGNCWWWLRTPGENDTTTVYVHSDGTISYWGDSYVLHIENYTIEVYYAVRPAMWIDLQT